MASTYGGPVEGRNRLSGRLDDLIMVVAIAATDGVERAEEVEMTVPAGTPGDEVPAEDWAEQAVETGTAEDLSSTPGPVIGRTVEADEADLAEQGYAVDLGDDEQ